MQTELWEPHYILQKSFDEFITALEREKCKFT